MVLPLCLFGLGLVSFQGDSRQQGIRVGQVHPNLFSQRGYRGYGQRFYKTKATGMDAGQSASVGRPDRQEPA